jgi:hypothetical protein
MVLYQESKRISSRMSSHTLVSVHLSIDVQACAFRSLYESIEELDPWSNILLDHHCESDSTYAWGRTSMGCTCTSKLYTVKLTLRSMAYRTISPSRCLVLAE